MLIWFNINSAQFNGADSSFTDTARRIVERCREALDEHDNELTQLENDIAAAKKAAEAEAADIDDPSNDIVSFIVVAIMFDFTRSLVDLGCWRW